MFTPTNAVDVFLWDSHLGIVSSDADGFSFQFDKDFIRCGIEVSPIIMPLRTRPYRSVDFGQARNGIPALPGFIAEPLMHWVDFGFADDWLDEHGYSFDALSPLDLLAFVGRMHTGALSYEPTNRSTILDIRAALDERNESINDILIKCNADESLAAIKNLCSLINNPQRGMQPKALVGWCRTTDRFLIDTSNLPANYERWIAKFSPIETSTDGQSVCAREYECSQTAISCGLHFSECRLLTIDGADTFITRRFDSTDDGTLHTQTLRAMINQHDHSPDSDFAYERLFEVIEELQMPDTEKTAAFRRVAFNILAGETDCHACNISFTMTKNGQWRLAPAYDITLNRYAPGEYPFGGWELPHRLSVNGKFLNIRTGDLRALADRFNVSDADKIITDVAAKLGA